MKMPVRILLMLLCAALILALPFTVSAPNMLSNVKMELMNEEDDEDEIDFGRLIFPSACAEEAEEVFEEEDLDKEEVSGQQARYVLPLDFSPAPAPNPDLYTEDGYEDETISVRLEHREMEDGTKMHIAYVRIADPSQLRTNVAHPDDLTHAHPRLVTKMTSEANAVIAVGGDNYNQETQKKSFEYRMTQKIRSKTNKYKDILIIDDQGDFHLFIKSQGIKEFPEQLNKEGRKIVNAFTFGPALVKDGELVELDSGYGYNPGGREPRVAIGQLGPLNYVLVVIEVKSRDGKSGFSQHKLAEFMYELGCKQAFNLDGGNSAIMVFGDQVIKGQPGGDERQLYDIVYFASAKP
jgi:exopolysaccharide biosynthesis protein